MTINALFSKAIDIVMYVAAYVAIVTFIKIVANSLRSKQ